MKKSIKQLLQIIKTTTDGAHNAASENESASLRRYVAQSPSQRAGESAEHIARDYLQNRGLHYVDSNVASSMGEIDLIMLHDDVLVFVEVKMRKSNTFGGALAAMTPQKLQRLRRTIEWYLQQNPQYAQKDCRIDAVAIQGQSGAALTIEWLSNIDSD